MDEGCCPYKGRVLFKCYNPSKPSKWHLKLFEVSDAKTGYVVAFEVYCGKNSTRIVRDADVLDPECTVTTKTVMGLLKRVIYWEKGIMSTWTITIQVQNFFSSYISKKPLHAVHVEVTGRICQKVLQRQS